MVSTRDCARALSVPASAAYVSTSNRVSMTRWLLLLPATSGLGLVAAVYVPSPTAIGMTPSSFAGFVMMISGPRGPPVLETLALFAVSCGERDRRGEGEGKRGQTRVDLGGGTRKKKKK